jgi:hypothetical protein
MPRTSPIIFWLLLAATLCVNAVSIYWIFDEGISAASATLYVALAFAELSALAVWAVLLHRVFGARWLAPFFAGLAVGWIVMYAQPTDEPRREILFIYTGLLWTHTIFVISMLWLLKPTRLLQGFANNSNLRWQFGVGHLLLAMTALALFLIVVQQADALIDEVADVITMCVANAVLLLAVLLAAQRISHWPFRLTLSLGAALAIAGVCSFTGIAFAIDLNSYAFNLVQALMLWAWIEVLFASTTPRLALGGEPIEQEAG